MKGGWEGKRSGERSPEKSAILHSTLPSRRPAPHQVELANSAGRQAGASPLVLCNGAPRGGRPAPNGLLLVSTFTYCGAEV